MVLVHWKLAAVKLRRSVSGATTAHVAQLTACPWRACRS